MVRVIMSSVMLAALKHIAISLLKQSIVVGISF